MKVDGEGQLFLSPSDLSNFLACEYITQVDLKAAQGELRRPFHPNRYADLVARKGDEHERASLTTLREAGHTVVEIGLGEQFSFEAAAQRTLDAIRDGSEYIYQAVLTDGRWRGIADFLERVDRPSQLGPWSYEVLDAKLDAMSAQHMYFSCASMHMRSPTSRVSRSSTSTSRSEHVSA